MDMATRLLPPSMAIGERLRKLEEELLQVQAGIAKTLKEGFAKANIWAQEKSAAAISSDFSGGRLPGGKGSEKENNGMTFGLRRGTGRLRP